MDITIAFNSANLVSYYSDYRFKISDWMQYHAQAADMTGPEEWAEICQKIRACGYRAIEVWVALVEKCAGDPARALEFRKIMEQAGLKPVALGGGLNDTNAKLCMDLGIPAACGGLIDTTQTAAAIMRRTGVLYNFENHPEKSAEECRQKINYGQDGLALAVDTGWLSTQGVDAPQAIRELGRLIRHVHLKDVLKPGAHETVRLGTGCTDIPGVVRELKAIGYSGVISWEDEPEDRNPFEIAAEMHDYIQQLWGTA